MLFPTLGKMHVPMASTFECLKKLHTMRSCMLTLLHCPLSSINELVEVDKNGLLFSSSSELADQFMVNSKFDKNGPFISSFFVLLCLFYIVDFIRFSNSHNIAIITIIKNQSPRTLYASYLHV